MKSIAALILLLFVTACSHPLEITGEGDILSASGDRDCLLEDERARQPNCDENWVVGAYQETYSAVPRAGMQFWGWQNYCVGSSDNTCGFNANAASVASFWGETVPSLHAVFIPSNCQVADGARFHRRIDWISPGRQQLVPMGSDTVSMEFITTSSATYGANISIASSTEDSDIQRTAWISNCPGGQPIAGGTCETTGTTSIVLRIYQSSAPWYGCELSANSRYYLNVKNENCASEQGCDARMNLYTWGNP